MTLRLLKGLAAGVFVILILYLGISQMLIPRFITSDHARALEQQKISLLQEYVNQNEINALDYQKLKNWTVENDVSQLVVSRGAWLLFDSTYDNAVVQGAKKISFQMVQNSYEMAFADGTANVFIDIGGREHYEQVLIIVSILSGLAVCLLIFVSGMHEDIVYIQTLEDQVSRISGGDLETRVTVSGKDELSDLARGLDEMRKNLLEKERIEAEMKMAQNKLVLGMSHDLRTPLTGLITYLEILRQQKKNGTASNDGTASKDEVATKDGDVTGAFVEKSMEKALQIRQMSDDLFEYFQLTSQLEVKLGEPEEIDSVFGDFLSEMYSWLKYSGFQVQMNMPEWEPFCVQVNIDFIGRIVNNILSNLEKYADRKKTVEIGMGYAEDAVRIWIQNAPVSEKDKLDGTGMGTKNIEFMMEQMRGSVNVTDTEDLYRMELVFPLLKS